MQKAKLLKNPAVRDTSKFTSKLSTHDTLSGTLKIYLPLNCDTPNCYVLGLVRFTITTFRKQTGLKTIQYRQYLILKFPLIVKVF